MPFHSSEQPSIVVAFTARSASLRFSFSSVFDVVRDDGGAVSRGVRERNSKTAVGDAARLEESRYYVTGLESEGV